MRDQRGDPTGLDGQAKSTVERSDAVAEPLLACKNLSRRFGGVAALTDATVQLDAGQIVSIIGPNGAGKTTLFNCLSGMLPPDSGEIVFKGQRIDGVPPQRIARMGLARTFQNIRMFPMMTVAETLIAAQRPKSKLSMVSSILQLPSGRRRWKAMCDKVDETLDLLSLVKFANDRATRLPLLQQRKIEIARCLVTNPTALLLDEPFAGSTPAEADDLMETIRTVGASGISVLLIEHSMRVVMRLSHHVFVMNFGSMVTNGTPEHVRDDPVVRRIYLATAE